MDQTKHGLVHNVGDEEMSFVKRNLSKLYVDDKLLLKYRSTPTYLREFNDNNEVINLDRNCTSDRNALFH
jgi:hypothetical protein